MTMFFHTLAWFLDDLLNQEDNIWVGFAIVTAFLFLLAIIAGASSPCACSRRARRPRRTWRSRRPRSTRSQFEAQKIERDQLGEEHELMASARAPR